MARHSLGPPSIPPLLGAMPAGLLDSCVTCKITGCFVTANLVVTHMSVILHSNNYGDRPGGTCLNGTI